MFKLSATFVIELEIVFLTAVGYPEPLNFCPLLKIRQKCGRRNRRQMLESRSAAEKIRLKFG